jgi:hypothetical protein
MHAFGSGAATLRLNPALPDILKDVAHLGKTPVEALADDAKKLRKDFQHSYTLLSNEVKHGQGHQAET